MPSLPRRLTAVFCVLAGISAALPVKAQSRGELLYTTHCIACHGTQVHWRDKKQVLDWPSLRAQVRYWQAQAMLGWSDDDIGSVARYLNDTFYRLPPPEPMAAGRALTGAPARP